MPGLLLPGYLVIYPGFRWQPGPDDRDRHRAHRLRAVRRLVALRRPGAVLQPDPLRHQLGGLPDRDHAGDEWALFSNYCKRHGIEMFPDPAGPQATTEASSRAISARIPSRRRVETRSSRASRGPALRDQPEAAREAHGTGQHADQFRGGGQGEIMHDGQPRARARKVQAAPRPRSRPAARASRQAARD